MNKINLHDAEIKSIGVDDRKSEVSLILHNGKQFLISFFGVVFFRASDVCMQNVISRVLFSSEGGISAGDYDFWLNWVTSSSGEESWLGEDKKLHVLGLLNLGEIKMAIFEPSAGAEMVCLYKEMKISGL